MPNVRGQVSGSPRTQAMNLLREIAGLGSLHNVLDCESEKVDF